MVLTSEFMEKHLGVTIRTLKATEQYLPVVLFSWAASGPSGGVNFWVGG